MSMVSSQNLNAILSDFKGRMLSIINVDLKMEVVDALPTEDISTTTIYLVPADRTGTNDIYAEYLYVNGKWEKIGTTDVDLTPYSTSEQVDTKISTESAKIAEAYTTAIATAKTETANGYESAIATAKTETANAYESAIATAKTETTNAYESAIATATTVMTDEEVTVFNAALWA